MYEWNFFDKQNQFQIEYFDINLFHIVDIMSNACSLLLQFPKKVII